MTEGAAQKPERLMDLVDGLSAQMHSLYDDELVVCKADWQRISSALRKAAAWLEADDRHDAKAMPYRPFARVEAKEAFRRALAGAPAAGGEGSPE